MRKELKKVGFKRKNAVIQNVLRL